MVNQKIYPPKRSDLKIGQNIEKPLKILKGCEIIGQPQGIDKTIDQ